MKEKNVAGILALFLGGFGVHRFYLNQTGLGILYLIFFWTPIMWIIGLIDAIVFLSMSKEDFDYKYNRRFIDLDEADRRYERRRDYRERRHEYRRERRDMRRRERPAPRPRPARRTPPPPRANPHKSSGIRKYKDYDYDGAIVDFQKALEIEPKDVAVHFNLACAYSLNENTEKAFYHLDKAVELGFDDFQRIREHDALAYLRIQPTFESFEENGFRLRPQLEAPKENLLDTESQTEAGTAAENRQSDDLLAQLKKLGDLRDKGLLTEEEFVSQKKKLLEEND